MRSAINTDYVIHHSMEATEKVKTTTHNKNAVRISETHTHNRHAVSWRFFRQKLQREKWLHSFESVEVDSFQWREDNILGGYLKSH